MALELISEIILPRLLAASLQSVLVVVAVLLDRLAPPGGDDPDGI